jgi:hypothetical protein
MNELDIQGKSQAVARAIALAEALLCKCDEHGFVFAAIDVSSALDKLKAIEAEM